MKVSTLKNKFWFRRGEEVWSVVPQINGPRWGVVRGEVIMHAYESMVIQTDQDGTDVIVDLGGDADRRHQYSVWDDCTFRSERDAWACHSAVIGMIECINDCAGEFLGKDLGANARAWEAMRRAAPDNPDWELHKGWSWSPHPKR